MTVTCRVVWVSRSGFYDWVRRQASVRSVRDAQLLELVQWPHERSFGTYGAPRVHADITMERGVSCGKKRVARFMRSAGVRGLFNQRERRGWKPLPAARDDFVKRQCRASAPNRVWFCGITQNIEPGTGGFVALPPSTPTQAWWSAGRLVTICGQNSWSMLSKWRAGNENQPLERPSTQTGGRNTPPGFSVTACVKQDCSDRWGKRPSLSMKP